MTKTDYTYAKAGGPPSDCDELCVWDLDADVEVPYAIEVNTIEGWVVAWNLDENGLISDSRKSYTLQGMNLAIRRLENF